MKSTFSSIRKYLTLLKGAYRLKIPVGPNAYAFEQKKLVSRLKWPGADSPRAYLQAVDKAFSRTLNKFEGTSAAATFSPHRPLDDIPYFVKTRTLEDLDVLLPEEDGYIPCPHVAHVGPKGSGKTTVQNRWLSDHHELMERRNVFFVRCDAPKIFELFSRHTPMQQAWDSSILPTLEEYLDLQLLYVLSKNSDSGLPGKIFTALKTEKAGFRYKEARALDSELRLPKEISWFIETRVKPHILNWETDPTDRDRSYVRDVLFRDKKTRRREYFQWQECADAVKTWMRARGYILLRILDGVDNLHLNTEAGKRTYNAFLPEVRSFLLRAGKSNEIRFAVMRNRTWIDLLRDDPLTQGSGSVVQPHRISHITPNVRDIANARLAWLRNTTPHSEAESTIESAAFALPDAETLHENIRNFIVCTSTLAAQVRFRSHQLGGDVDTSKQAHTQMKRNLFLNGRFFLTTERDWAVVNREKGLPFLNPLWFPDDHALASDTKDPLFLRIRLLELLHESDLLENRLLNCLNVCFGYDLGHIRTAVEDARAFGWIDSKAEHEGTAALAYELSEMGKYLLENLLSDLSVIYMLALDVRVPKYFFTHDLIQVHTNHMYEKSGYLSAATITVLTIVLWLKDRSNLELADIENRLNGYHYKQIFLAPEALKQIGRDLISSLRHSESSDRLAISEKCDLLLRLVEPTTVSGGA